MARIHDANFYSTILTVNAAEKFHANIHESHAVGLLDDYQPSLKELLGHEGGYTNDPQDPGGPTNWGITIFDARMYWKPDATARDVKEMPLTVAKGIYKAKYWNKVRGDELPAGIDYCIFDFGVNSGVSRAVKLIQRLVAVAQDGVLGDATLAAINAACASRANRDELIDEFQNARLKFLQGLHTWGRFGGGWGRRVREVRALAMRISANPTGMVVGPSTPVGPAAPVPLPPPTPPVLPPAQKPWAPASPPVVPAKPPLGRWGPNDGQPPLGPWGALARALLRIFGR